MGLQIQDIILNVKKYMSYTIMKMFLDYIMNSKNTDQPAKPHDLIRTLAIHHSFLQYPVIL